MKKFAKTLSDTGGNRDAERVIQRKKKKTMEDQGES